MHIANTSNGKLLAIGLDEDFIDAEGVTLASVLTFQWPRINVTEFYAPKPDGVVDHSNSPLS